MSAVCSTEALFVRSEDTMEATTETKLKQEGKPSKTGILRILIFYSLAAGPTEVISLYSNLNALALGPPRTRMGCAYDVKKSA